MKTGDLVLITGKLGFFDKAEVTSKEKDTFKLSNGLIINKDMVILNGLKTGNWVAEPFDQKKYDLLVMKKRVPRLIDTLASGISSLDDEQIELVYNKISKLLVKLKL